jgi:hypothetical protein
VVTHPEHYQFVFDTPIPGYYAPDEATHPVANRALGVLINVLADAFADGRLRVNQPTLIIPK